jgi:uncharacterized membrane protein
MASWSERAFDTVTEITKQVLVLATGIIALSITFVKDFATHASSGAKDVLAWSWGVYVVSIICGFLTLMASAGVQQEAGEKSTEPTINSGNLRLMGALQLGSFSIAIILTVIAGIMAV